MLNKKNKNTILSIPAGDTVDLIYKYEIHSHPNKKGYEYKNTDYCAFREKGGVMNKLFEVVRIVSFNPRKIEELKKYQLVSDVEDRIINYINDRNKNFGFSYNGEYKFYILEYKEELKHRPMKPKCQKQCYISLDEITSGKVLVDTIRL